MSLPRYFVPHATSPAEPVRAEPEALAHLLDVFRLESAAGEQEWLVGLDAVGQLVALPAAERERLTAGVQAQLAHHEVALGRSPRRLAAAELWLFSLELAEHPADAEGVNDPVYLYGTLIGPWPGSPTRVPGQLTANRGAVLAGLAHGAEDAFVYAQEAQGKAVPRGYHALLPGDRAELLAEGRGLVLAYPAAPPEQLAHSASNARLVADLLHDVLVQLRDDAARSGGPAPLAKLELPVPSRAQAEIELKAKGYDIEGEVAVLRRKRGGVLGKLATWLDEERIPVPREAPTSEFVELARKALAALPGWPSEAERALRARVRPGGAPAVRPVPAVVPARTPAQPIPPRPLPAPARPSDWMQDFLDAHARTAAKKPAITRPQSTPAAPAPRPASDWSKDFASPAAPKASEPEPAKPGAKPDWMKDFES